MTKIKIYKLNSDYKKRVHFQLLILVPVYACRFLPAMALCPFEQTFITQCHHVIQYEMLF